MNLKCLLRGHRAAAGETYNSGFYFSRCHDCGSDMIRSHGTWQKVPRGHRVVWKEASGWHSVQPDFGSHLPVLHNEANLPAVPVPGMSWSRALVALRGRRAADDRPDEAEGETSPPLFLVVALWAGLRILFALQGRPAGSKSAAGFAAS